MTFFRFPHTPHIAWLGPGQPRDDKILDPRDARELLAHPVVVEEKVDGANLGFSVAPDGTLQAQNRGSYLDLDNPTGQWKPLRAWLAPRRHALADALEPHLILFGEWCYAVHSVEYSRLPDWFLAFDVYDRAERVFWDTARRNAFASQLGIHVVPERARGRLSTAELVALLDTSALNEGPAEGVYIRQEENGQLVARAKLVRAEFVQTIEEHWSRRVLVPNRLTR